MDRKNLIYLFFILIVFPLSAQQKDSIIQHKLSDIVVSATKTKNSTMYTANSVSVIDSAEISRREKITLLDLLNTEYGLSLTSQGNPRALSFVNIRGAGTGHTLVLIDGIEMNMTTDPANAFNFSTVTTENINRIEILRGPQGTLYGADAAAGVINIFTNKGSKGLRLNLASEAGSYNTYRGNAALSGGTGLLYFNLNYGRITSDGYSSAGESYGNTEKDGYSNSTINARGGIQVSPDMNFDLRFHFTKASADLDRFGGAGGDDPTYIADTEESGIRGSVDLKLFDIWEHTAGASYSRNFRKYSFDETPLHSSASRSRYDGNKTKIDWQSNLNLKNNIITAGLEFEEEKAESDYSQTGDFPYTSVFPKASNNNFAVFLQEQFRAGNSFFLTLGGRYDDNRIFGSKLTYRIAPAVLLTRGTKLKATYGTGFKAPSLYYLFDPVYGNNLLNPEDSRGWDAGIEHYFTSLSAGVTFFKMDFRQMFGLIFDEERGEFRTININRAASEGVEVYIKSEIFAGLSLKTNYTFTDVSDRGSSSSALLRKPKHYASLSAEFSFLENLYSIIEIIYRGSRKDIVYSEIDFSSRMIVMADYTIINYVISYNLFNKLKLYARFENLLNREYEEIYGFGTPGFSIYGGVKIDTNDIFK